MLGDLTRRCNPTRVLVTLAAGLGRRLRHGLVIAALALFTAVAVGAGSAVLSSDAGTAAGATADRPARSSLDAARSIIEGLDGRDDELPPRPPGARPSQPTQDERATPTLAPASASTAAFPLRRLVASAGGAVTALPDRLSHLSATPPLKLGDRVVATVSFYYCLESPSVNPGGDGGGFCGAMRDGVTVYPGAAACDVAYLGQRFRIVGDPLERTYTCNDTGSAVHGLHRDIWFYASDEGWNWQRGVGALAVLEVVD